MDALFVGPDQEENLSLGYLSSSVRGSGHQTRFVRFEGPQDTDRVLDAARDIEVACLSPCSWDRLEDTLALAPRLKAAGVGHVVVGGAAASGVAGDLLRLHPDVDVVVIGEGERTLVELLDCGLASDELPFVYGIAWRSGLRVLRSPPRPRLDDLDTLPWPDRWRSPRLVAGLPTAWLIGSRGCLGACGHCCITPGSGTSTGARLRRRQPEAVAREMAALYEGGVRQFVFHDDNFLVPLARTNLERLGRIARELHRQLVMDIALVIRARPAHLDADVLALLCSMGLVRIELSVGSASPAGLGTLDRRDSPDQAWRAMALCREAGVSVRYALDCFHPDCTTGWFWADLHFVSWHLDSPMLLRRITPFEGTRLVRRLRSEGRMRGHTWTYADPTVARLNAVGPTLLGPRCWAPDGLLALAGDIDHRAAVVRRAGGSGTDGVSDWLTDVHEGTADLLATLLERCATGDLDVDQLADVERTDRARLHARGRDLARRLDADAGTQRRYQDAPSTT